MKLTKKQILLNGGIAFLLVGGAVSGVLYNQHVQTVKAKIVQEEKAAYAKLLKTAQEATKKAESFKVEADVKTAQDAIKKLEEKDKPLLVVRVEKVRQNWDLVNKAEKNVAQAEKAKTDATIKTAQTVIDQLKDGMTKAKKTAFQHRLDKVKAVLKAKKDKAAADKKAQEAAAQQKAQEAQTATPNNTAQVSSGNDSAPQTEDVASNVESAYNGYTQTPAQPAPSAQAPMTGSVGQAQAPAQSQQSQPSSSYNPPAAYVRGDGANANPYASIEQADKYIEQANANKFGGPSADGGR